MICSASAWAREGGALVRWNTKVLLLPDTGEMEVVAAETLHLEPGFPPGMVAGKGGQLLSSIDDLVRLALVNLSG
jgi:hypothetical protein